MIKSLLNFKEKILPNKETRERNKKLKLERERLQYLADNDLGEWYKEQVSSGGATELTDFIVMEELLRLGFKLENRNIKECVLPYWLSINRCGLYLTGAVDLKIIYNDKSWKMFLVEYYIDSGVEFNVATRKPITATEGIKYRHEFELVILAYKRVKERFKDSEVNYNSNIDLNPELWGWNKKENVNEKESN